MPISETASPRAQLCDALDAVEPDAPTLCDGWTAHDLAAHVWIRENDMFNAAGIMIPRFAGRTARRSEDLKRERPYSDLVAAIRQGPARFSPFRLPGAEAAANTMEFFVHCEDVRRAQPGYSARPTDQTTEAAAWRRAPGLARIVLRGCPVAVWLDREVAGEEPTRIGHGPDIVTLRGRASEMVLYLFGRTDAADLEVIGEAAAIATVARAMRHI